MSTRDGESKDALQTLADELHDLGAETQTERTVKKTVPWVASVALHGGIFILAILVAGTVRLIQQNEVPLIVADFDAMNYDPVARMDLEQMPVDQPVVQDKVPVETIENTLDDPQEFEIDPLTAISDAASESVLPTFAPRPSEASATFVGLRTTNARRLIYVIDASGSMTGHTDVVIEALGRSLDDLSAEQSFGVIFFRGGEAIELDTDLVPATDDAKVRAIEWADRVTRFGNSNPLPAFGRALGREPDVIFLLSDNITGAGQFEIDQRDLFGELDRLNPRDRTTGRRLSQIHCVQFLDPDPLNTLRLIAEQHDGKYKFLDREELGLSRP